MTVTRYDLTVYVETLSPLHSGGIDEEVDRSRDDRTSVPRAFARDGRGRPVLTGRSVKGAFRAAWQRHCEDAATGADDAASSSAGSPGDGHRTTEREPLERLLWGATTRNKADRAENEVLRAAALTFHPVSLGEAASRVPAGSDSTPQRAPDRRASRSHEAGSRSREADSEGEGTAETDIPGQSADLPTRTGIAVDRYWGTAGSTALFQHEYVPAGRLLELRITAQAGEMPLDSHHDSLPRPWNPAAVTETQVESLLTDILGLLKAGLVTFGGRKGAGWGRVQLASKPTVRAGGKHPGRAWHLTRSRLGSREDLRRWLSGGENITGRIAEAVEKSARAVATTSPRVRIEICWTSPTGILVATPPEEPSVSGPRNDQPAEGRAGTSPGRPGDSRTRDGKTLRRRDDRKDEVEETTPTVPLRSGPGEDDPLVLPGSSVRGALRSRASRIARTVLAAHKEVHEKDWQGMYIHAQLAEDPPLVRDLFGSTEHRGALTVLDTEARENGTPRTVTHNAGDRWTGGAAGGALYSEKVYDGTRWNDIVLEVDLDALGRQLETGGEEAAEGRSGADGQPGPGSHPGPPDQSDGSELARVSRQRAAWCLLGLTLAELAAGTLPLGSRSTRGMGQVRVTGICVSGTGGVQDIVDDLPWDLAAPDDDVPGASSLARQVLTRLQDVNKKIEPQANSQGLTGWSSYLVEPGQETEGGSSDQTAG
ncbi:RAMP superfamily CRISPR-associated protein [Actinomyces wuliandei]|uniref:RAMP superfamily CRISPR-associated protein n=1 Tax=Actinomyces wuliandei TaxID=2057743 RepID=UPI000FDB3960|nr:RAMP superfamily CRISPR-associated protein [Actinomyces wuliandei]